MKPFGTNYNQSAATPPMGRRPPPRQIPASVYSRQRLGNPKVPQPCQPPDDRSAALAATGGLAEEAEASPRYRKSVGQGKGGSRRGDLGGGGDIKKKKIRL